MGQAACATTEACTGVYDNMCDGKSNLISDFMMCGSATLVTVLEWGGQIRTSKQITVVL